LGRVPIDLSKGKKIDFKAIKEEWNEYELEDGTKLKVKLVLVDVLRFPDYTPLGEPVYQIMSRNVLKTTYVPDDLKKKPKPSTTPIAGESKTREGEIECCGGYRGRG